MPTLTITANAKGVITAIGSISKAIEKAEQSAIKLAAVASTISNHFAAAQVQIVEADRRAKDLLRTVRDIAKAAKAAGSGIFSSGGGGNLSAAAAKAFEKGIREGSAYAQAVAKAMRSAATSSRSMAVGFERSAKASALVLSNVTRAAAIARTASGVNPYGGGGGIVPRTGGGSGVIDVTGSSRILEDAGKKAGKVFTNTVSVGFKGLVSAGGAIAGAAGSFVGLVGSAFSTITSVIGGVIGTAWEFAKPIITGVIGAALVAGTLSVREAISAQPINNAFNSITEERGLGAGPDVLRRLQGASQGTISNRGLQTNANAALFLGAANTTEEIESLITAGRRLGEAFGRDATEGFNDLAIGIGRQSRLILDNLGLIVRTDEAYADFAKTLGTTVAELDENSQKAAFQVAAYEAVAEKLESLGDEQDTAAKGLARLTASAANFGSEFAAPLLGPITDVANRWAKFLSEDLDPDGLRDALANLTSSVGGAGSSLLDTIFGTGDFRSQLSGLGSDLFTALTDPSEQAFKILGVRFSTLFEIGKVEVGLFLDTALDRFALWFLEISEGLNRAIIDGLVGALKSVTRILPAGFVQKALGLDKAFDIGLDALGELKKNSDSGIIDGLFNREVVSGTVRAKQEEAARAKFGINSDAESQIFRLRASLASEREAAADRERRAGPSSEKDPAVLARENADKIKKAALAEAKAREEQKEEIASNVAQLTSLRSAFADQEDATRDVIRETEREIAARERVLESLEGSGSDLGRSLAGLGSTETIEQQAARVASSLRAFPDAIDEARDAIDQASDSLALTIDEASESTRESLEELNKAFRDSARAFLGGGDQDGETVAVRAARRRFQRDQQRAENEAVNSAFRSNGVQGFGSVGGFGTQGVDQLGGAFRNIDPRAIAAVQNLEALFGGGQITDALASAQEARDNALVALDEAVALQTQALEAEKAQLAEQQAVRETANDLLTQINGLIADQIAETAKLVQTLTENQARVTKLEADQKRLQVEITRARRA